MRRWMLTLGVALALASGAGVEAQRGPGPAWTGRPRPLATRPMGVPASVQPVGRPSPPPPGFQPAPPWGWLPPPYGWMPAPYVAPAVYTAPTVVIAPAVVVVTYAPIEGSSCAVVLVEMPTGAWINAVRLPALDAGTPDALQVAVRTRLAAGRAVSLTTTNGTAIRILPGRATGGVRVEPCGSAGGPR